MTWLYLVGAITWKQHLKSAFDALITDHITDFVCKKAIHYPITDVRAFLRDDLLITALILLVHLTSERVCSLHLLKAADSSCKLSPQIV